MSQRLKSKDKQIPNGFYFRHVEINWDSRKVIGLHPSFSTLVSAVMGARKANPSHAAKHKWALDRAGVENDVELFQVKVCLANGWTNYITESGGGAPPPLSQSRTPEDQRLLDVAATKAKKLWAGVRTLGDWLDSGEPPVEKSLAESRAATCVACPQNGKGDLSSWFTKPASAAISRQLAKMQERNISTTKDAELNVCELCLCPLKLKVQTPIKFIKPYMAPDTIRELKEKGKDCWLPKELGVA